MSVRFQTSRQKFAYISHNFINLYSEDNMPLNVGDETFLLFNNMLNINRPLIAKGTIVNEKYGDGVHKHYFVMINEVLEPEYVMKEFVYSQHAWFETYTYGGPKNEISNKVLLRQFKNIEQVKANAILVEAFFCRQNLKDLIELRNEYVQIISEDIQMQQAQIDEMLRNTFINKIVEKSENS